MSVAAPFFVLKSRFAKWLEWEPNPILVKELRQAVRSRILTSMLLLFLASIFLVSVKSMAGQGNSNGEMLQMGRKMFDACLKVLALSSLVLIPLYTGIRVGLEKHQSDLILFTPLPVARLVQGKVWSGVYVAVLFFSVCMPFMIFSTLMRGLDWLTVQFVLFLLFTATYVAVLSAIAVAVLPVPFFVKLLFGAGFAAALVLLCGLLVVFLSEIVQSGAVAFLSGTNVWSDMTAYFGMLAFGALIAYGLSLTFIVTHKRPADPDRSHP